MTQGTPYWRATREPAGTRNAPSTRRTGPAARPRAGHILLVDDDESVLGALEAMLRTLGYGVSAAASANQALAWFAACPDTFDLIISDESMPAMPGLEFCTHAKRLRADIPFLLISGLEIINEPASYPPDGFIRKPITLSGMEEAVLEALRMAPLSKVSTMP